MCSGLMNVTCVDTIHVWTTDGLRNCSDVLYGQRKDTLAQKPHENDGRKANIV